MAVVLKDGSKNHQLFMLEATQGQVLNGSILGKMFAKI